MFSVIVFRVFVHTFHSELVNVVDGHPNAAAGVMAG